jgi:hypothetical protein
MYQRYRQLIQVLMLSVLCLNTLVAVVRSKVTVDNITYYDTLTAKHYGAITAAIVLVISFLWQRKYFNYALLFTFLLWTFRLINATLSETSIGLGIGELSLHVNPFGLLFGLLAYALNYQKVNTLLYGLIKPSEAKVARTQHDAIAEFKEQFTRKSSDELTQILAANKLVPAALAAAQQLLQERHATTTPQA